MLLSNLTYKCKNPQGEIIEKNTGEVVSTIKKAILKHVDAKYIYLFGSYAYGKPEEDSDIDIYIVTPDNVKSHADLSAKIFGLLRKNKIYFVDLVFVKESAFQKKEYLVEKIIHEKGILLYERERFGAAAKTR